GELPAGRLEAVADLLALKEVVAGKAQPLPAQTQDRSLEQLGIAVLDPDARRVRVHLDRAQAVEQRPEATPAVAVARTGSGTVKGEHAFLQSEVRGRRRGQ